MLAAGLLFASAAHAAELTAEEILQKADEVRNPQQLDYTVTVAASSYRKAKPAQVSVYQVMVKGRDKTLIRTLSPANEKGRLLLMSGNDLWAYLPTVSKPLRISLQERLTGEVANGDLARTNFSGDYTPRLLRLEQIDGVSYHVIELIAKTKDVTYARVVLWVDQIEFRPHHAEFYAISGRLLKTCLYEGYRKFGERLRPTRLTLRDAVSKDRYSVLDYKDIKIGPLPDKYFTKDYMKKLME